MTVRTSGPEKRGQTHELYGIVLALLFTGGRVREVLSLDWIRVDLVNKRLTLVRTKTNDELTMEIAGPLLEYLGALNIEQNMPVRGLVFTNPNTGQMYKSGAVYMRFKPVVRRLGIGWMHPKVFRKLAGTVVAEETGGVRDAQEFLGHDEESTTRGYLGRRSEARARAVRALEGRFGHFLGNSQVSAGKDN